MSLKPLALAAVLLAAFPARAADAPRFEAYPAPAAFAGHNAAPRLATPAARRFRTQIAEAARQKPNFAGHSIVGTWGCGAACETGAIIDAATGNVVLLPVVAGIPADAPDDFSHFAYRLDSRLIVLTGMIAENPPMAAHYFSFDGKRLVPLTVIPRKER